MKDAQMLYKSGTNYTFEGVDCDVVEVDISEVPQYLANGWYANWTEIPPKVKRGRKPKADGDADGDVTAEEPVEAVAEPVPVLGGSNDNQG